MKKGEILEGTVQEIQFPNKGVVLTSEERPVIVKDVLPGQRVRVMVSKVRKGRAEGRLLEVLEKAPQEIAPTCPHFGLCGGCTYQHLPYDLQLEMKANQVREILSAACSSVPFEGIQASPQREGYRNKMEFSFGDSCKDGPLALGLHKKGSFYDIVTVDQCRIVNEDFLRILRCVLEYYTEQGAAFYHKLRHEGYLRHLLIRKAQRTGEILVDLVTSTQTAFCGRETEPEQLAALAGRLAALPLAGKLVGVLHTRNDSLADVIRNDGTELLYGQEYFHEELLGLRFRISPFSFFQTNSLGAEELYKTVRSFVGETRDQVIFDLYSGTGTIAQILAPVARKVIGIEIVEEAVEAARQNARENGLENCEFLAGDVLKAIDLVEDSPDLIVLDPPREGIHPKALEKIIAFGVPRMVYISCKPTSLARDLEVLLARGYSLERICCTDLFPNAVHVETICLLSQRKPEATISTSSGRVSTIKRTVPWSI